MRGVYHKAVFLAPCHYHKDRFTNSEDKGAVIASANLSTSALGASEQKEIGVFLPPDSININRLLESIKYYPASDNHIARLDTAHKDYWKRNPSAGIKSPGRTFARWYELSNPTWKLFDISRTDVKLSPRTKAVLEEKHGSTKYTFLLETPNGWGYRENDWILCFNANVKSGLPIRWVFAHHIVPISRSDIQIVQVSPLRAYDSPPFERDELFRKAFGKASDTLGGGSHIMSQVSARPPIKLLKLIDGNYFGNVRLDGRSKLDNWSELWHR